MVLDPEHAAHYTARGWWRTEPLSALVRALAAARPDDPAYVEPDRTVTWREYDRAADAIAAALAGIGPGARVALLLPDTAVFHAALLGTERAGVVAVGIGARAGDAEIAHLITRTGARTLITTAEHRGRDLTALPTALAGHGVRLDRHLIIGDRPADTPAAPGDRALGPNDLWLLNATSGTTGLPKIVTQYQNRWMYLADLAVRAAGLGPDDVILSAVPAPYGFGLWSAHFLPALLGVPAVVLPRFDAAAALALIDAHRVTVLCAVTTQFRMMLKAAGNAGLTSLHTLFTGGEPIPYADAAAFEDRTGAVVLNFFGSNESGAFSRTTRDDPRELRLTTGGRVLPEMDVRLYDEAGHDVTASGGPGRPGGMGPLVCAGYYDDPEANARLYAPDGRLLMGDLVTIDADGYLRLVGRASDIIIRGGRNISAAEVEAAVAAHPAVELAAAVPVPDPVYGERVCAVVSLLAGHELDLPALTGFLAGRGMTKELLPERLVVLPELPRSAGGKIARARLREIAREAG